MNKPTSTAVLDGLYDRLSAELASLIEANQASVSALPAEERSARLAEAFVKILARILDGVEPDEAGTRELSKGAARTALGQFREHEQAALYRLVLVDEAHYARARRWIETFRAPLRTLDALHLAVAARSGCTLLTADIQLARAARSLRVRRRLLRSPS